MPKECMVIKVTSSTILHLKHAKMKFFVIIAPDSVPAMKTGSTYSDFYVVVCSGKGFAGSRATHQG